MVERCALLRSSCESWTWKGSKGIYWQNTVNRLFLLSFRLVLFKREDAKRLILLCLLSLSRDKKCYSRLECSRGNHLTRNSKKEQGLFLPSFPTEIQHRHHCYCLFISRPSSSLDTFRWVFFEKFTIIIVFVAPYTVFKTLVKYNSFLIFRDLRDQSTEKLKLWKDTFNNQGLDKLRGIDLNKDDGNDLVFFDDSLPG